MKKYSGEQMRELMTDAEWSAMGIIMFDNCTVEDKQTVISLYLQEKEKNKLLEKSIRKAAEILHVAPAHIDEMIKKIEEEVKNEH